jgi:N-glycosidase YbiA
MEVFKMSPAEQLAKRFHDIYEELAPKFDYETRRDSAVDWKDVPSNNKNLMIAVCQKLLEERHLFGNKVKQLSLDFQNSQVMENENSNQNVINFYSTKGDYGCFSNFSAHPIELKGKIWRTTEHYFQAQKFPDTEHEEEIHLVASPMVAARMGRSRSRPLRKDWETAKDNIMREALVAKFTQHLDLKEILLGTGDALLVEHTKNDKYWGDGGDGSGQNKLGKLLMEVREELRQQS